MFDFGCRHMLVIHRHFRSGCWRAPSVKPMGSEEIGQWMRGQFWKRPRCEPEGASFRHVLMWAEFVDHPDMMGGNMGNPMSQTSWQTIHTNGYKCIYTNGDFGDNYVWVYHLTVESKLILKNWRGGSAINNETHPNLTGESRLCDLLLSVHHHYCDPDAVGVVCFQEASAWVDSSCERPNSSFMSYCHILSRLAEESWFHLMSRVAKSYHGVVLAITMSIIEPLQQCLPGKFHSFIIPQIAQSCKVLGRVPIKSWDPRDPRPDVPAQFAFILAGIQIRQEERTDLICWPGSVSKCAQVVWSPVITVMNHETFGF